MLCAACCFLFRLIPESPRWYFIKGKYKKSEAVLRHMAEVNGKELPEDFDISQVRAIPVRMNTH